MISLRRQPFVALVIVTTTVSVERHWQPLSKTYCFLKTNPQGKYCSQTVHHDIVWLTKVVKCPTTDTLSFEHKFFLFAIFELGYHDKSNICSAWILAYGW
jgi:hypothetical protein